MRKDLQYLQEEVQDLKTYLKHLQSIFQEFDNRCFLVKVQLEQIFYDGLKHSIWL